MKFSMERGEGGGVGEYLTSKFSVYEREEKSESRLLMLSSWSCTLFHGRKNKGWHQPSATAHGQQGSSTQ